MPSAVASPGGRYPAWSTWNADWVYWKTRARTGGHGQADTDTYGKDGQLLEKTDSYGKDGQLWKRRTLMEKTDTYGKYGHLWKKRTQSI